MVLAFDDEDRRIWAYIARLQVQELEKMNDILLDDYTYGLKAYLDFKYKYYINNKMEEFRDTISKMDWTQGKPSRTDGCT